MKNQQSNYLIKNTFFLFLVFNIISFSSGFGQQKLILSGILAKPKEYYRIYPKILDSIDAQYLVKQTIHFTNNYPVDFDSLRYYAHSGISTCYKSHYNKGRMQIYAFLAYAYMNHYFLDSCRFYLDSAIIEAKKQNKQRRLAIDYLWYGFSYDRESKYDSALIHFQLSYQVASEIKDTFLIQAALRYTAKVHQITGNYTDAINQYNNLQVLNRSARDSCGVILNYCLLGDLFHMMGLYQKEIEIARRTLKLTEDTVATQKNENYERYSTACWTTYQLAMKAYMSSSQFDSVLYFARQVLPFSSWDANVPLAYKYIADVFLKTYQMDSAQLYCNKILSLIKDKYKTDPTIYLTLGNFELKSNHIKKAFTYYSAAEADTAITDMMTRSEIFFSLYQYYKQIEEDKNALTYFINYKYSRDQIQNNQNLFAAWLTADADAHDMSSKIDLLTQNNQLQSELAARQRQQKQIGFAGSALVFLLAGFGFVRFRKNKELKTREAMMAERLRISRDLHDEVGATLSGIAMYSHLAKKQIRDADLPELKASLDIMQQSSGETVGKLSDIVWLLNPEQDTLQNLIDKLEDYAKQLANAKGIRVRMQIPDSLHGIPLPLEDRRNIYLVCKEAINNSMKYSQATVLDIRASYHDPVLEFSVEDNGLGFDLHTAKKGNGLENMQKRCDAIKAKLNVLTTPGSGTRISLAYNLIH